MTGKDFLKEGEGILRLKPTWVSRSFCRPGRRIKLHPDDYYVLGVERGGIDERWFASTTWAENGPVTAPDEGLSYVVSADGSHEMLLKDMVAELKGEIIGDELWKKYGKWPMFSKFCNDGAINAVKTFAENHIPVAVVSNGRMQNIDKYRAVVAEF